MDSSDSSDEEVVDTNLEEVEDACDEFALSRFPPSYITWAPNIRSDRLFNRSLTYNLLWDCPAQEKVLMLQLRRLLSTTFPYYLPQRYHSMDCKALLDASNRGSHEYLRNTVQFLVFSQVYSVGYWSHLEGIFNCTLKNPALIGHVPHNFFHLSSRQVSTFEERSNLHLCLKAKEFLTEPWVLVQLPWNPVLLHQWLVAALAEVHTAKKNLAEFSWWPVPQKYLQRVQNLTEKAEKLHLLVITGFRLLGWLVSVWPERDVRVSHHILQTVVLPAMPLLLHALDDQNLASVNSLKLLVWPKNMDTSSSDQHQETKSVVVGQNCCCDHETIYSFKFNSEGDHEKRRILFGYSNEGFEDIIETLQQFEPKITLVDTNSVFEKILLDEDYSDNFYEYLWQNRRDEVKHFVLSNIEDILEGVDEAQIPWEEFKGYLCGLYYEFTNLKDLQDGMHFCDTGAIHSINFLDSQNHLSRTRANVSGFIRFLLQKQGRDVQMRYKCCCEECARVVPLTLEQIDQVIGRHDTEWSLDILKQQFAEEVRQKVSQKEECQGVKEKMAQTIASFELRIRRLVFSMFEESLRALESKEEAYFFPEWQFVQYLLPSFVALIGDLAKSKVKQTELDLFIKLVHSLIQSYELHLDRQPLKRQEPATEEEVPPSWVMENKISALKTTFGVIEKDLSFLVQSSGAKKALQSALVRDCFTSLLDIVEVALKGSQSLDLLQAPCLQMDKFLNRLHTSIRKVELAKFSDSLEVSNMLRVLEVLQHLDRVATVCQQQPDVLTCALLEYVDHRVKSLMGKQPKVQTLEGKERALLLEMRNLGVHQLLGIILHRCVLKLRKGHARKWRLLEEEPGAKSSLVNEALALCQKQKWHKLKLLLVPLLSDKNGNDLSLVSLAFAKKWPLCYGTVVSRVSKMKEDKKLEREVLPLLFCRNCSKFEGKVSKCQHCSGLSVQEFPDVHLFCSPVCEEQGLKAGHELQHHQHLVKKLGFAEI